MIFLLLDILIYNFTKYNTYLILLNFVTLKNKKTILFLALFLDCIVFHTWYKNLIVFLILLLFNEYIYNFNTKQIVSYLAVSILNYVLFLLLSNIINGNFNVFFICTSIVESFFLNFTLWVLLFKNRHT